MRVKLFSDIPTESGVTYKDGSVAEVPDELAEKLIAVGVAAETDEEVTADAVESTPETKVETQEVETAADPLVPPTGGPSEASANESQTTTVNQPPLNPEQPSSTDLHLG